MAAFLQHRNKGTCKGDSGGPLVFSDTRNTPPYYTLVGVLHGSVDNDCDLTHVAPGLFARVDHPEILEFIQEQMEGILNQSINQLELF